MHAGAGQCSQEVLRTIEARDLNVGVPHLDGGVAIAPGAHAQSTLLGVGAGPSVLRAEEITSVEHFEHIDIGQDASERSGLKARAAVRVEGVWYVHDPSLPSDGRDRRFRRQVCRYLLLEEEANDLTLGGSHFFANDDPNVAAGRQLEGAADLVVVGDADGVEPRPPNGALQASQAEPRIFGPVGMTVHVKSHDGWASLSGTAPRPYR